MKRFLSSVVLVCGIAATSLLSAQGLQGQSMTMFNTMTNVNQPQVVLNARGGLITGGGIQIRNQQSNIQLFHITPPHINAGCGGIDAFLGSFSFISAQQIVDALRSIASAALGYAFKLALTAMCPNCNQIMDALASQMNNANFNNLNSCRIAQSVMDASGASSSITAAASQLRPMFDSLNQSIGGAQDYMAALSLNQSQSSAAQIAQNQPGTFAQVVPGNAVWRALNSNGGSGNWLGGSNDRRTMEEIMSLFGTVVVCVKGQQGCPGAVDNVAGASSATSTGGAQQQGMAVAMQYQPRLSLRDVVLGSGNNSENGTIQRWTCTDGGSMSDLGNACTELTLVNMDDNDGLKQTIINIVNGKDDGTEGLLDALDRGDRAPTATEAGLLSNGGMYIQLAVSLGRKNVDAAKQFIIAYADVIAAEIALRVILNDATMVTTALSSDSLSGRETAVAMVHHSIQQAREDFNHIYQSAGNRDSALQYFQSLNQILRHADRNVRSIGTAG